MCLSNKSSLRCCQSYTFPKTPATASSSPPASFLILSGHLEGWVFRQKPGGADHHECALSAGATISGREGPGLAVGSWALSVSLRGLLCGSHALHMCSPWSCLPSRKGLVTQAACALSRAVPTQSLCRAWSTWTGGWTSEPPQTASAAWPSRPACSR